MRALRLLPLLSLFALACAPDYKVEGEVQDTGVPSGADADSGGVTDDSEAFLDEVWAGASGIVRCCSLPSTRPHRLS